MIVLVDLEWLENSKEEVTPTQLAAIRLDDEWNTVSEFNSLCRPADTSFHQWNHMAYAGYVSEEFLQAAPARVVFDDFCNWIQPDDVLLWWAPEPPSMFAELLRIISKKELKNKNHHVRNAFKWFVADGRKTKGSVYHLASMRQIPLLKPEHCSLNDVRMMQILLKHVGFQLDWIYRSAPIIEERKKIQSARADRYQFQIDSVTLIAHTKGCSELDMETMVVGCDSINTCIKYHAKPCPVCCKAIWMERLIERNKDIMQRTRCNYFYLEKGRAFHKASCWIVQRAAIAPKGTAYHEACEKAGKVPCKICNPMSEDDWFRKKKKKKKKKKAKAANKNNPSLAVEMPMEKELAQQTQKISMTMAEQQAMRRYKEAAKERKSLDLSEMKGQAWSDAMTLTATRYAFWAVAGYSTFHIRSCSKLNGMSHIKGFSRYSEAVHAGYKPCRQCKPTPKYDAVVSVPIYNEERGNESVEDIICYCEEQGIKCSYEAPMLVLETRVGHWRVDTSKRPIFIEHMHIGGYKKKSTLHWQPRMFLSLADVIQYIIRHDKRLEIETD